MSHTKEMLEASPAEVPLGAEEVAAAIDACLDAVQACTACADADLAEDNVEEMRECIALDAACADVCSTAARVLSRPAHTDYDVLKPVLQACVRVCRSCAEECERHADHHRHCAICAKVCRACVQACTVLLETELLQEYQRFAGG